MLCCIYEFEIDPNMEQDFENAWLTLSRIILQKYGSLGARLHKIGNGKYFAYAQWPDEETWKTIWPTIDTSSHPLDKIYEKDRLSMKVVFPGKVVKDCFLEQGGV